MDILYEIRIKQYACIYTLIILSQIYICIPKSIYNYLFTFHLYYTFNLN